MNYTNGTSTMSSGLISATKSVPEPVSASRIRDGITAIEETLSALHDAIGSLESRLETVLQPQPPSTAANASIRPASVPQSHVMGRVSILQEGFEAAINRVRDIAIRIEV